MGEYAPATKKYFQNVKKETKKLACISRDRPKNEPSTGLPDVLVGIELLFYAFFKKIKGILV
jgi:hypothetical protein